jgi:hypothetical protein
MSDFLVVTIPDHNAFYSLYADGVLFSKTYDTGKKASLLAYDTGSIVFLYYTYPTHREACVVRNIPGGRTLLPGCSKRVSLLFSLQASRVDKLKRAAGFLNKRCSPGAFARTDGFYLRLYYLLSQRGKLNYLALRGLASQNQVEEKII